MSASDSLTPQPPSSLLDELRTLRALAHRLLRDSHAAEDAVQDTVLAAMTRPAPRDGALRAWLAAILRNTVRQRARANNRRTQREEQSATARTAPPAAEVAAELEEHRQLLQAIHELEERTRQVVLLRYWRGLAPVEIAELLGIPRTTVYARLRRGLQRLRRQLDRGGRTRGRWSLGLIWLRGVRAVSGRGAGMVSSLLLMKTKILVASIALAAVALLLPFLLSGDAGGEPRGAAGLPAATQAAKVDPRPEGSGGVRSELGAEGEPPAAKPAARAMVTGTVQDLDGAVVGGVRIVFRQVRADRSLALDEGVAPVTSGADGRFALPLPLASGCLDVDDGRWATVLRPWLRGRRPDEAPRVVVAPRRRYGGTVVAPDGAPVAGARVVVEIDGSVVPARAVRDRVVALPSDLAAVTTDARGGFVLEGVGYVGGARLRAECDPWRAATVALPADDCPDLLLRLGAPDAEKARVYGVVLDAQGAPLAGVWVAVGGEATRSGSDGRFAVVWARRRPAFVRAVRADRGAVEARLEPGPGQPGWRPERPITLVLPDAAGCCTGRVVDAEGRPVAGARVWTPDLTYLGKVVREEQGHQISWDATVERVGGSADPWTLETTSGADGTFVLGGLMGRRYALFALDPRDLSAVGPRLVAPGDDVELRLAAAVRRRVAGRVVAADGAPLAGVQVWLGRSLAWQPPVRKPDPWLGSPVRRPGASRRLDERTVVTGRDGRFAFGEIVVEGSFLGFGGERVFLAPRVRLEEQRDVERLRVVVPARSTFRVVLADPREATSFRLERDGRWTPVFVTVEGFEMSMGRIDLVEGRSPVAYSAAGEVTVVLLRGDEEVRRARVTLPAGRGHVIEP